MKTHYCFRILTMIVALCCLNLSYGQTTYTVSNTSPTITTPNGLHWAIDQANNNPGVDIINFSIDGTIDMLTNTFIITEGVIINGTTAPGYVAGTPSFILDRNGGTFINTSGSPTGLEIKGLGFTNQNANPNGSVALDLNSCTDFGIQNNEFTGMGTSIDIDLGSQASISDNDFNSCGYANNRYTVEINNLTGIDPATRLIWKDNEFISCGSALSLSGMDGLAIDANYNLTTTEVHLPTGTFSSTDRTALALNSCDNITLDGLDFSNNSVVSGTGVLISTGNNLTVQNLTINNKSIGIQTSNINTLIIQDNIIDNVLLANTAGKGIWVSGGQDAEVLDNTIKAYGITNNQYALTIDNVSDNGSGDRLIVNGTTFVGGGNAVSLSSMDGLTIDNTNTTTPGQGVHLPDADGRQGMYNINLHLNNIDNTTINNFDLSYTGGTVAGQGLNTNGCDNLTVTNNTIENRSSGITCANGNVLLIQDNVIDNILLSGTAGRGIWVNVGQDVQVIDNTLRGMGRSNNQYALTINNVSDNGSGQRLIVNGTTFVGGGNAVSLENMDALIIDNIASSGQGVHLPDADGRQGMFLTNMNLSNIDNTSINNFDLSYTGGTVSGSALNTNGCDNLNVINNTINNRSQGVFCANSSALLIQDNVVDNILLSGTGGRGIWINVGNDIEIIDNTIRGMGRSNNQYALTINNVSDNGSGQRLIVNGTTFVGGGNAVSLENMDALTIDNIASLGQGVHLPDADGRQGMFLTNMNLSNIDNTTFNNFDLSYTGGTVSGNGLVTNGCDNFTIRNNAINNRSLGIYCVSSSGLLVEDNNIDNVLLATNAQRGIWINNGNDIEILDNTIKEYGYGNNIYALTINNVVDNGSGQRLVVNGTTFVGGSDGVSLDNMDGLIIDNVSSTGQGVHLPNTDGRLGMWGVNMQLSNIDNTTLSNFDLSYSGGLNGSGLRAINCDAITIQNFTIANRSTGMFFQSCTGANIFGNTISGGNGNGIELFHGSNYLVQNNSVSDFTSGNNNAAYKYRNLVDDGMGNRLSALDNSFSNNLNGIYIGTMDDLIISDGSVSGSEIVLKTVDNYGSDLNGLKINTCTNTHIENLSYKGDASAVAGTAIYYDNSTTSLTTGVSISYKGTGLFSLRNEGHVVQQSLFQSNTLGVNLSTANVVTNYTVENNNFLCNGEAIRANQYAVVDAANNFWGQNDGSSTDSGSGDIYAVTGAAPNTGVVNNTTTFLTSENSSIPIGGRKIFNSITAQLTDGQTTTSVADSTDYETVNTGDTKTRQFRIVNSGTDSLHIASIISSDVAFTIANAPDFVLCEDSVAFDVIFAPTTATTYNSTITVNQDDCYNTDFEFAVDGEGVDTSPPSVTTTVISGSVNPTTATDGESVEITVTFSEDVTTTAATATIPLTVGGVSRTASLPLTTASGSSLVFAYTVQAGDNGAVVVLDSDVITLTSGTIQDGSGNNLTGDLGTVSGSVTVDTAPSVKTTVLSGSVNPSTATDGESVEITVTFSEDVTITAATATIPLTVGGVSRTASIPFTTVSGSSLVFMYAVQAGDNGAVVVLDSDVITLTGGTIQDGSGNNLTGDLGTVSGSVTVDTAPSITTTILSGSADPNIVVAGESVEITVTFSEDVTITAATATIPLTVGGVSRTASIPFTAGSGSSLLFAYAVQAGDNGAVVVLDSDVITLTSGTIQDGSGNNLTGDLGTVSGSVTVETCDIAITSATPTDEGCPGADDGEIDVVATCTTCTSIEYSVDDFATMNTTGDFAGLADGTYTVKVRDSGDATCADELMNIIVGAGTDTTDPVLVGCPTAISLELDLCNELTITAADLGITATDNCGTPTIILSQSMFTSATTTTITVTAMDDVIPANTSTCDVDVTTIVNPNFFSITTGDDDYEVCAETSFTFTETSLLSNDNATNSAILEIQDVTLTTASDGILVDNNDDTYTFTSASGVSGDVSLTYLVTADGDDQYNPDNGHYYVFVAAQDISWIDAKAAAEGSMLYGQSGYLATITSQEENDFIETKLQGHGWVGGLEVGGTTTGEWRWVTGPEGLMDGGLGLQFWNGNIGGTGMPGVYENWVRNSSGAVTEPNNANGGEEYLHMRTTGDWNDYPIIGYPNIPTERIAGYVIEYGSGTSCSPDFSETGNITITVNDNPDIATIATQVNTCPSDEFDVSTMTITDNNNVAGTATTYHSAMPTSATDMANQLASTVVTADQTVFVMVANTTTGCYDTESFMVDIATCCDIAITSATPTDEVCPGADDGEIDVVATCTSCTGIEYSIDNFTTSNTTGDFTSLADGTYTVKVRDSGDNSCAAEMMNVVVGAGVDTETPVLANLPSDITLSCTDNLPMNTVTTTDNCGGVFGSNSNILVDYSDTGWKYMNFSLPTGGDLCEIPAGMELASFDDSAWPVGGGGFSNDIPFQACGGFPAQTLYPLNSQMVLRREVTLPAGASGMHIKATYDNGFRAWVNGTPVVACTNGEGCDYDRDRTVAVVPDNLLLTGANTIVVVGYDTGSFSYLDATITLSSSITGLVPFSETSADGENPGDISIIERSWAVVDASGNQATHSQKITIQDTEDPVALCTDITINLVDENDYTLSQADIDMIGANSTDNCGTPTYSISAGQTVYNCADVGSSYTVTLTADDGNGNTHTCTAMVTIADPNSVCCDIVFTTVLVTNETCPGANNGQITVNAACGSCDNGATDIRYSIDNSDFSNTSGIFTNLDPDNGPYTVYIHDVNDTDCGATQTGVVITSGVDNTPPEAMCPANQVNLYLDASGSVTLIANSLGDGSSTDNCDTATETNPEVTYTCADLGAQIVVLTADDGNGNMDTENCTVMVLDTISPTITCGSDVEMLATGINCDADASTVDYGNIVSGDNCGVPSLTNDAPAVFPVGTTTVTHTATDASGRTATCTQDVTVYPPQEIADDNKDNDCDGDTDETPLLRLIPAENGMTTGTCVSNTDCCMKTYCYSLEYTPDYTGTLANYTTGFIVGCGDGNNPVTYNESCVMTDNSLEISDCAGQNGVLFNSSGVNGSVAITSGTPVIIHQICFEVPDNDTLSVTADDITGLTMSIDVTPTFTITETPVYEDIEVAGNVPPMITMGSIDACYSDNTTAMADAIAATTAVDECTPTVDITAAVIGTCGTIVRVYAADACGLTDSVDYITVIDGAKPVVTGTPTTTIVEGCLATEADAAATTVTELEALPGGMTIDDACTIDADLTVSHVETVTGNCPIVITRVYTITDGCGNSEELTHTINVNDTAQPVLSGSLTIVNLEGCNAGDIPAAETTVSGIEALAGDVLITDACPDASLVVSYVDNVIPGCVVQVFRVYTVTDECGNFTNVTQQMAITDTTAPTLSTGSIDVCYATVEAAETAALDQTSFTDNCAAELTYSSFVTGTCPSVLSIVGEDLCGNKDTVTYSTQINVNGPAEVGGPISTSATIQSELQVVAVTAPVYEDDCGNTLTGVGPTIGGTYQSGDCTGTITYSYDYTDCSNSVVTWTFTYNIDCQKVNISMFLEGPYDMQGDSMENKLNFHHLLPGQDKLLSSSASVRAAGAFTAFGHPYQIAPWNYTGTLGDTFGDVTAPSAPANVTPYPDYVMDWVLVTIRENGIMAADNIWQCAGWLNTNGEVTYPETCPDNLNIDVNSEYYVVVEHRNHLTALDTATIMNNGEYLDVDFRYNNSYVAPFRKGQKELETGIFGLFSGNGRQSSGRTSINSADRTIWRTDQNRIGYFYGDFNLNIITNSADETVWKVNQNTTSGVRF